MTKKIKKPIITMDKIVENIQALDKAIRVLRDLLVEKNTITKDEFLSQHFITNHKSFASRVCMIDTKDLVGEEIDKQNAKARVTDALYSDSYPSVPVVQYVNIKAFDNKTYETSGACLIVVSNDQKDGVKPFDFTMANDIILIHNAQPDQATTRLKDLTYDMFRSKEETPTEVTQDGKDS
jgi:hypothetical protein